VNFLRDALGHTIGENPDMRMEGLQSAYQVKTASPTNVDRRGNSAALQLTQYGTPAAGPP